jgi:hypothetical protein
VKVAGPNSVIKRRGMSANLAMISDGKKFMWDGRLYTTKEEASGLEQSYRNDNFEVRMVEQEGKFLVYTRRVVKEVVVAAP